jgi:hypothetical protein
LQAPLFVIFLVSAIKEGVDDVRRHRADREVNRRPVSVLRNGVLQQVRPRRPGLCGLIVRMQTKKPQFIPHHASAIHP